MGPLVFLILCVLYGLCREAANPPRDGLAQPRKEPT